MILGFSRGNQNFYKIQVLNLMFIKLFHRDLFAHKTLAKRLQTLILKF